MSYTFAQLLETSSLFYTGGCSMALPDLKQMASEDMLIDVSDERRAAGLRDTCVQVRVERFFTSCILELTKDIPLCRIDPWDNLFEKEKLLVYGNPLEAREFKDMPLIGKKYMAFILTTLDMRFHDYGLLAIELPENTEFITERLGYLHFLVNALATGTQVQRFNVDASKLAQCKLVQKV